MIVCILDTTVVCELLGVPGKSERHQETFAEFDQRSKAGERFFLPLSVILETGNHVAQVKDGAARYPCAQRYVRFVQESLDAASPFTVTPWPQEKELASWLLRYPDHAQRGIGFGDQSLIALWSRTRERHPHGRVYIWSFDEQLTSYDTG